MKKFILLLVVFALVALPSLADKKEDLELARTQDYIAAATKQGQAKVNALLAYIKKFPDTTQKWTKFAYYSLAIEYFQVKNYPESVKYGKKTLEIGVPGTGGEEARLYLVMGNCYAVKSSSIYNKDEALKYTNKAISFSTQKGFKDVVSEAKKLKDKLTGPPPKKLTPEQQIKKYYADGDYSSAASFYKSLGEAEKGNVEIHKTYANALFKKNSYDAALTEFKALYEKDKKGIFAFRIGEIYEAKAKKDKSQIDFAVNYFLEASLLYGKEKSTTNQKAAYKRAQFEIFEKYGFNKKVTDYNKKVSSQQASAKKNEAEIARLGREIRKQKRHIRTDYERAGMDPPQYELNKLKKLQDKKRALESGASPESSDEGKKLQEEKDRIEKELKDLLAMAKKRLNL